MKIPFTLLRSTLFKAAYTAGDLIRRNMDKPKQVQFKNKSPINLVTWVDKAAEKKIVRIIKRAFPDHAFLTEEDTVDQTTISDYKWIIDPLDGTTNYAHSFPQVGVSIGLEYKRQIILSGVYDPFRDELFWAQQGKGAHLVHQKRSKVIHVSQTPKLTQALLLTGFPYDRNINGNLYLKYVEEFLRYIQGIRRAGAAALDLCWVACGRVDGYWEWNLKPWDSAAGKLIVEEAGGKMSDFNGKLFSIYGRQTLANNGVIHKEMLGVLRKVNLENTKALQALEHQATKR